MSPISTNVLFKVDPQKAYFNEVVDKIRTVDGKLQNDGTANGLASASDIDSAKTFVFAKFDSLDKKVKIGDQIIDLLGKAAANPASLGLTAPVLTLLKGLIESKLNDIKTQRNTFSAYKEAATAIDNIGKENMMGLAASGSEYAVNDIDALVTRFSATDGVVTVKPRDMINLAIDNATDTPSGQSTIATLLARADIKELLKSRTEDSNKGVDQAGLVSVVSSLRTKANDASDNNEKGNLNRLANFLNVIAQNPGIFMTIATATGGKLEVNVDDIMAKMASNGAITATSAKAAIDVNNQVSYTQARTAFTDLQTSLNVNRLSLAQIKNELYNSDGSLKLTSQINDLVNQYKNDLNDSNVNTFVSNRINTLLQKYYNYSFLEQNFLALHNNGGKNTNAAGDPLVDLADIKDANNDGKVDV